MRFVCKLRRFNSRWQLKQSHTRTRLRSSPRALHAIQNKKHAALTLSLNLIKILVVFIFHTSQKPVNIRYNRSKVWPSTAQRDQVCWQIKIDNRQKERRSCRARARTGVKSGADSSAFGQLRAASEPLGWNARHAANPPPAGGYGFGR